MKKALLVILVCSGVASHAQIRRFEISAGIGNNNQVENVINDYFYPANSLFIQDEASTSEGSTFKYNITGRVYFNERYSFRLRYGHAKMENSHSYSDPELFGDFSIDQVVTNINPAFCISENVGRFHLSTGIEFAFYKVKDFTFFFEGVDTYTIQNTQHTRGFENEFVMDGGKVTGINNFIDVEFSATSRLGIGASVSYGMMFAKFGDQTTESVTYIYQPIPIINYSGIEHDTYIEEKKYKKQYFSAPEISVYLFFRFGKPLVKK